VKFERLVGRKGAEWVRRYLPCEIAGTAGEFSCAAIAYSYTGSVALAALFATIGASVGYYATAFTAAVRWSYRSQSHLRWGPRNLMATLLALRSVAIEFGPAELIDSIFVRPVAFYVGPYLFGSMLGGWIFGKIVADIAFYACAIVSYERFRGLLAGGRTPAPQSEPAVPLASEAV
jgi:hypothetical protein